LLTDEQLLMDYGRGRGDALAELIRRYQQELYAFLHRYVNDQNVAEDLFQETFVQVHRSAARFDTERRFRPWLFTIAANKARDHLRVAGRRHTQSLDQTMGKEGETGLVDLLASDVPTPPMELSGEEDIAAVRKVLSEMAVIYKEVLMLSFFQQMSYKEMAETLGVPLGTVKSRLHSAVAVFAKSYGGIGERQEARGGKPG